MYFPRPSGKSIPAAAFWEDDTRYNRSRFPSEYMVRKSSCIFLDCFLFCIPWIHLERMWFKIDICNKISRSVVIGRIALVGLYFLG